MAKKPAAKPGAKKAAAKKAAPKKAAKPPIDWVSVLRSGPIGVKKWNKLTHAQRKAVSLSGVELSGCDLAGINLYTVEADKASFAGSTLTGARLTWSQYRGADFTGADLRNADIAKSQLHDASFASANLTGANLSECSTQGADFTGATLADAKWDKAWFNKDTKWPAGFVVPGDMTWAGKGTDPRLSGKGKKAVAADINGLMARLHANIDERRMKRVLDMLKKERNQIFSEVEPALVRGIVKSQRDVETVYSCVLTDDGTYSCCTPDMSQCMGLSNEPCKHLLVLVIGLARAGQFEPATADKWLVAANKKGPRWNKTVQSHMADSLLKFKGVQAGEVDWRPTETIPEDFYAM